MFTPMEFNTIDFNACKSDSFISFIFPFFHIDIELFKGVFPCEAVPGICGVV